VANFGPSWTDNVVVQAPWALIKGATGVLRCTTGLDLRAKYGGYLKVGLGFGGGTDLTNGVDVIVRRMLNNDGAAHKYGAAYAAFRSAIDTAFRRLTAAVAAGQTSFAFDGHAGATALPGDLQFFWGVTTIPSASGAISPNHGCEILRVSSGVTTPFLTDSPSKYDHHDDEYVGLANAWELWLPGGATYELIFDYGDDSAGEAVAVMADIQTCDKIIKVT